MDNRNQIARGIAPQPRDKGLVLAGSPAASRYANIKLEEEPRNWKAWIIAALLLLLLGGTVGGYFMFREDPQIARAKEIMAEFGRGRGKDLSREERRAKGKELRDLFENMTEGQRQTLRKEMMEKWRKRESERLAKYFAMSPEDKIKYLDQQIEQQEARRQQFEEMRQKWAEEREKRKQEAAARGETVKEDNRRPGWGPGGGRGAWSKMSPEERDNRRKQFLDSTTPEERQQRWEYRQDMNARRQALGLPVRGGRGGRWGGP
jgi:hypothetical protein